MRISKSLIMLSAVVVALGTAGVATASSTAAPKAVGACAKQSGGGLRLLEPRNVTKSQYGACKKDETRVLLPTSTAKGVKGDTGPAGKDGRGFDGAPFKMTFAGNGPWSCSWKADTQTLACITPAS